jgi:hypothetical protein
MQCFSFHPCISIAYHEWDDPPGVFYGDGKLACSKWGMPRPCTLHRMTPLSRSRILLAIPRIPHPVLYIIHLTLIISTYHHQHYHPHIYSAAFIYGQ